MKPSMILASLLFVCSTAAVAAEGGQSRVNQTGKTVTGEMRPFDLEQSAGGWGLNCDSGTVSCTSGRNLDCYSTVADGSYRSECTQNTGDYGWVYCAVYDSYGNTISSYSDACP